MKGDSRSTGLGLVGIGLICQEVGASVGVMLFAQASPVAVVSFRLAFSAILLLAITRPRLRGFTARQWRSMALLGAALMGMNTAFYLALQRLDLGVTVTIEVLGPLVLSVVMAKKRSAWLWAILAGAGVFALGAGGWHKLDPLGVVFALIAGAGWAGYILASARVGRDVPGISGLALAMTIGALLVLPFGIAADTNAFVSPNIVFLGLAVAVLSSLIPYSAEMLALRRMSESTFAILMSLGPATASLAGFVLLGQRMSLLELFGMALVIAASMGAVLTAGQSRPAEPPAA